MITIQCMAGIALKIRNERADDVVAISQLTSAAFSSNPRSDGTEASVIERLREAGDLTISLVAIEADEIVGYIAFSPVTIVGSHRWFGLGPVSVAVERQRNGIGSRLIQAGLDLLKSQGASGCVLVGNPKYYSRFGFVGDGKISYGTVPSEFVQWLAFDGPPPLGNVKYRPAFGP